MKRLLCLLLILCLPATALAETIAERIGAPETWQGEFQSNTGRSHIYVDMTVEVPNMDSVPIFAVRSRTISLEEIVQLADLTIGRGRWHQEDLWNHTALDGEPRLIAKNVEGGTSYGCYLQQNDSLASVYGIYTTVDVLPNWYMFNSLTFKLNKDNTGRNVGTLENAVALADAVISQIAPDMVLHSVDPEMDGAQMSYRAIYPGEIGEYGYRFHYARKVGGLLVTPVSQQGASDVLDIKNPIYSPVLPYEKCYVDVGENGVFQLSWEHPIEIVGTVAEDCQLLSFDEIMSIFGAIAPLTIQASEAYDNNALYIDRAVLGYMCLQERGNPTSYQLIPVWDFFGERTMRDDRFAEHNNSLLTINAIDGTIIDRSYGY